MSQCSLHAPELRQLRAMLTFIHIYPRVMPASTQLNLSDYVFYDNNLSDSRVISATMIFAYDHEWILSVERAVTGKIESPA